MTWVKAFVSACKHICYIWILHQELIRDIIILNCYGLTENVDDKQKNGFYDSLEKIYDTLIKNYKLIVDDLNAEIGLSFRQIIRKES